VRLNDFRYPLALMLHALGGFHTTPFQAARIPTILGSLRINVYRQILLESRTFVTAICPLIAFVTLSPVAIIL
jgi:hypothetical protein